MTESSAFRRRKASAAALLLLPALLLSACGGAVPEEDSVSDPESAPPPQLIDTVYPDWHAKDIYTEGDIVIYDGKYFRAQWWTRNDPPSTDGGVWACLGDVPQRAGKYFDDVHDDAWYAPAINTLTEKGILTGLDGKRTFQPSRTVTRAQFAVMLCRALDIAPVDGGDNFADAGDTWYTPYLAALKQQGLAGGAGNDCFAPERQITRQELCKLIYDASGGFSEDPVTAFAPYTDAEDVAVWAIRPLSWCVERGILQGSGGRLLPERTASRAEAAQILYNLLY